MNTQFSPLCMKIRNFFLPVIAAFCITVVPVSSSSDIEPQNSNKTTTSNKTQESETVEVVINNFTFTPQTLTVKPGTTIVWNNKEGAHTVKADNGSWESPTLTAGKTFSRKFAKPGKYPYFCTFHGDKGGHKMAGVIIVKK
jgi:plastocyanin